MSSPSVRQDLNKAFKQANAPELVKYAYFDSLFEAATKDGNFKNLIIVRYGGIGDLIALSSIIDYFDDCQVYFITNEKYFPLFDWFVNKPKLLSMYEPIFTNLKLSQVESKLKTWAKYNGEGVIENGHNRNWFELFFSFVGENEPDIDMLRPQLMTERIHQFTTSNIQLMQIDKYGIDSELVDGVIEMNYTKPSLLICNKATAMMRTISVMDIIRALPINFVFENDVFVYENSLSKSDKILIPKLKIINIIGKTDLKTFLLDCYDADMVISVDTGALHFREGINKPAIGIYNSFTTDSRTKHYQYTKSFDIKSDCDLQPCFLHERPNLKHCPKGNKDSFAAPCLDSKFNVTLHEQLSNIFNENL